MGTTRPGIGVTASLVRRTFWITHGWRPISVTDHPASVAMNPNGVTTASARNSHRCSAIGFRRSATTPTHRLTSAITVPSPTMI